MLAVLRRRATKGEGPDVHVLLLDVVGGFDGSGESKSIIVIRVMVWTVFAGVLLPKSGYFTCVQRLLLCWWGCVEAQSYRVASDKAVLQCFNRFAVPLNIPVLIFRAIAGINNATNSKFAHRLLLHRWLLSQFCSIPRSPICHRSTAVAIDKLTFVFVNVCADGKVCVPAGSALVRLLMHGCWLLCQCFSLDLLKCRHGPVHKCSMTLLHRNRGIHQVFLGLLPRWLLYQCFSQGGDGLKSFYFCLRSKHRSTLGNKVQRLQRQLHCFCLFGHLTAPVV